MNIQSLSDYALQYSLKRHEVLHVIEGIHTISGKCLTRSCQTNKATIWSQLENYFRVNVWVQIKTCCQKVYKPFTIIQIVSFICS